MRFYNFLCDNFVDFRFSFRQDLQEMFDSSIRTYPTNKFKTKYGFDFEESFVVGNLVYTFVAKLENECANIAFVAENDWDFKTIKNSPASKVFAGVFECVRDLMKKHKVTAASFSHRVKDIEPNMDKKVEKTVVDLYDSKLFKDYVNKRFAFELKDKQKSGNKIVWYYEMNQEIKEDLEWE